MVTRSLPVNIRSSPKVGQIPKGKDHVLMVREDGAKMPADLGGDIYALLKDRSNIAPIEKAIRDFVRGW